MDMTRRTARIEPAGAVLSLAVTIVGVWWWAVPASYPFGSRDRVTVSLSHLFEHDLAGMMMIAAGVTGLAVSLFATRAAVRPLILTGAVAEVLFFGVVMSDAGIMSVAGYAGAMLGPVALAAILVTACVRRRRSAAAARWGRIATIAAALCPLPYALYRLTWLTPWPTDADLTGPSLPLALRLQGSLIGFAALIASVLTLGLISRWGESFPRWMPVLRDRPVPVRLPVIAGGLVAGALCLASPGMVVNAIERDMLFMLALFPYPLWGVFLAAAVFAYWLRRRPGPPEPRN
jgi:hypothetical protein